MWKLLVAALVTVAVTDLCSAVVLIPMSDYGQKMENSQLDKCPAFSDLRRTTYGYSTEWRLYNKIVKRSFLLALKSEADSFAQKNGCSLPVQKGLLRLNREFFRYHIRTVLQALKFYRSRVDNPPKTSEDTQHYIDDMTKKCAKALNLERAYSYALSHNMPICTDGCWHEAKELPESILLPDRELTGNEEVEFFG
ncbi:uncharacterized protein LOC124256158 [Haliotis rubra]|uniref:uncharacterized protein LOC124256158 n=1 Tax=Haliotis rubra TaxID=36100 RepID=UPI001EE5BB3B|nr:uncharacterized protein LOC124256158 [Haliotis rubra]